jgi:hypothetical protein
MQWINKIVPAVRIVVGAATGNWGQMSVGAAQLVASLASDSSSSGTDDIGASSGDE